MPPFFNMGARKRGQKLPSHSSHSQSPNVIEQNQQNFNLFRRDLLYAGFSGEGFQYERDGNSLDHGIWQFEGQTSDRSLSQISQFNVLSQGLGRENLYNKQL